MPKRTLYLSIILLILIVISALLTYRKNSQSNSLNNTTVDQTSGPSLSFFPDKGDLKIGENFEVKIMIDTKGKEITGADAVIKYDPEYLEIVGEVITGEIFPVYPIVNIKEDKGEIDITGTTVNPDQSLFTGSGQFASIIIKPIKAGQTPLVFEFSPGLTDESNLPEKGTSNDVLTNIKNAEFNIVQ